MQISTRFNISKQKSALYFVSAALVLLCLPAVACHEAAQISAGRVLLSSAMAPVNLLACFLALAATIALCFLSIRTKQESEERIKAHEKVVNILESLQDGFFAVDKDWNFTYVNSESKRIWGMEDADLIGKNLWEVHAAARGTEFERQNTRALREQVIVQYEEYYPLHGIWYEVRVFPTAEGLSIFFRDVTAAHAAKAALERSEQAYRAAQEIARIGNWEIDRVAGTTYCSPQVYQIYGLSPDDAPLTLETALARVHPADREKARQDYEGAAQRGVPFEARRRLVLPTGELRCIETCCQVMRKDGAIIGLSGTVQDVTERRQAEERFETLFEHSSDAHLLFDDTGIIDCNNAAVVMLRCQSKKEVLSLHPAALSPTYQPDGRLSMEKCVEMDNIAREQGSHRFEWMHRKMDGEVFPVEVSLTPVVLNEKPALLVVWHDLTERKRAEEELRQSHAKLAALIEGLPDILYRVNRDGVCVDYIAHQKDHARYQAHECIGRHLTEVLPPEVALLMQNAIEIVLATKTPQLAEYALAVQNETRFREARVVAQADDEALIIVRDITDRRVAEQKLDELHRQNQLLLQSIGEGVYGINLQGEATFVNPAAAALLDYENDELLGRNMHQIFHHTRVDGSAYPAAECPIYCAMREGEVCRSSDEVFWRKDGTPFAVEYVGTPIREAGAVVGMVVSFQDITERKNMENQIERQILKMNEYSVELEIQKSELEAVNRQLERLATTDGLTGLNNHRHFQTRFAEAFQMAARYGSALSVLILDVDHFKQFNDTFGHPAGDQTLKTVANALTMAARATDFVARYGGEEFAVIMTETDSQGALKVAERFRAAVAGQEWPHRAVTVSVGVATWNLTVETAAALLEQADNALYASKRNGRDRATHFSRVGIGC